MHTVIIRLYMIFTNLQLATETLQSLRHLLFFTVPQYYTMKLLHFYLSVPGLQRSDLWPE